MYRHLDLSAVEVFVLVADLRSFSRAADALGMTQSGVSMKVSRLEKSLGRRLIDRTPRRVRLSLDGECFLIRARELLAAQESALDFSHVHVRRLKLGVSAYLAGPELAELLSQLVKRDPALTLEVEIGTSVDLLKAYDQGKLDAVIVRKNVNRRDGETLFDAQFGWIVAAEATFAREPLPLVTVADTPHTGIRSLVLRTLKTNGVPWKDVFIGSGVAAVLAAVGARLGVAPLPLRLAPPGTLEVGATWKLPILPTFRVALHTLVKDQKTRGTLRFLADAMRGAVAARVRPGKSEFSATPNW